MLLIRESPVYADVRIRKGRTPNIPAETAGSRSCELETAVSAVGKVDLGVHHAELVDSKRLPVLLREEREGQTCEAPNVVIWMLESRCNYRQAPFRRQLRRSAQGEKCRR